jgi:transcriptional regulator with XRE-family HTH domain
MGASGDEPAPSAREVGRSQVEKLGRIIRERRVQAELSLRDLAARTNVSNPYLSQIERGLHQPSVRVLKAIAGALNMSAEALMVQAGLLDEPADAAAAPSVAEAVRGDPDLTDDQRAALLAVYRSYVEANRSAG